MSSRKGRQIICKYAQCSGGIQLHMMRSAMRYRTWWFRTESPTLLWWEPVSQRQTEVPDADADFFDPPPGRRSSWKCQSPQSGPTLHWDAARELGWMGSTRSCERVRRTSAIIASSRGCLTRREAALFSPPLLSACGAMGPSMEAFLTEVYGRAKEADKYFMSQQPALRHAWNTMVASSFWDMRLSIAHNFHLFCILLLKPLTLKS